MKMFFEIIVLIIITMLIMCLFFSFAQIALSPSDNQSSSGYICIKEKCFYVEIAETDVQRQKGLMFRTQLDKDKGMLFIFDEEDIYPFWMKNTLIPLDMIWIDSSGKVVFIAQNVMPCKTLICPSITPAAKAKCVLEINAGLCENIGIKLGDKLKININ